MNSIYIYLYYINLCATNMLAYPCIYIYIYIYRYPYIYTQLAYIYPINYADLKSMYRLRNLLEIQLHLPEFRMCFPFSDRFGTKRLVYQFTNITVNRLVSQSTTKQSFKKFLMKKEIPLQRKSPTNQEGFPDWSIWPRLSRGACASRHHGGPIHPPP